MKKKTKRAKHARSKTAVIKTDEVQILDRAPTQENLAEALRQARDQLGDPSKLSDDEILQLHRGAEHELELMAARSRSYALRAYTMGLALAARKKTIKYGDYTRWVEKTLKLPRTTANRYKLIYERLTALAAQTDQYWSVSLLDLPVDRLEKYLREALPAAKKRKKAERRESGDGRDEAQDAEDRGRAEDRQAEAGASADGARAHGGEETEVDPKHATARADEEGGESDEDADRDDEDADADDEEDEAAGEPEAKAEAEDGDDEHDGDRSTSATETDEHEDADEGDAGDDDGDDEGGGDLLREFERVTQSSHGGFRRAGK